MNGRARRFFAVVALVLVVALPSFVVGPGLSHPGLPMPTAPVAPSTGALVHPATPRPAITCPPQPPAYPYYNLLDGAFPLTPSQRYQGACGYVSVDEVHALYASPTAGSAERFTLPVHLPRDGNTSQSNAYNQFWVGTVVKGDHYSVWGQSYAAAVFQPAGAVFSERLHIFSLIPDSFYGVGVGCPTTVTNLTWNASFFCEIDDFPNSTATTFPAGDQLSITFAGSHSSGSGLAVWINDSTTPSASVNATLNASGTGTYQFDPAFSAACPDACLLNWSMQVGLGEGFTICPIGPAAFATCDSYNSTTWSGSGPPEFGIPHFYQGGSYSGDYRYFAPGSDSGVCNANLPIGLVSSCFNNDINGGNGFYPWFTYNGSQIDFGTNWTWTTQNWGGASTELPSTGGLNDLTPFYFYRVSNDSRDGFAVPGATINVTAHLQDLGTIAGVYLNYQVNGGPTTSLPMTFSNGSASDANFSATIPSGPNGWVNFSLNATNHANAAIRDPYSGQYHIQRGPLPTFHVAIAIALPGCASVVIGSTSYANNTTAALAPGYYPVLAQGCYPWIFQRWTPTRGLTLDPVFSVVARLGVSASGTITTTWQYVRPLVTITAHTAPSTCGQVELNGSFFSDGQSVSPKLSLGLNYSLQYLGCGGKVFAGWSFTGLATILGGGLNSLWNFVPWTNGTITANFIDSASAKSVVLYTNPSGCGGVLIRGAGYTSGTQLSLAAGTYPIAPDPCFHFGFRPPWVTTGGVSVNGTTLTVTTGGSVTENYYVLTVITTVIDGCGAGYLDGSRVRTGDATVVQNNSTHTVTASACTGWYLFNITGSNGVSVLGNVATANGSGTVTWVFIQGSPNQIIVFLTQPSGCGSIVFAGVTYGNSNYTSVAPGTIATIAPVACAGYGFLAWVTYGLVTILGSTAWLNGSGAIQAVFQPIATLYLYTSPSACGSVAVANVSHSTGSTLDLTEYRQYTLSASPCTGYGFSNWVNSSGAQLPGGPTLGVGTVFLSSSGVLTAIFAPIHYAVLFTVNPPNCGGLRVSGQNVANGTTVALSGGTYSLVPTPCPGNHLVRWDLTGNLSVVNATLWVNGSGAVGAVYQPVPPTVSLLVDNSSFSGTPVPFGAAVAVPVPPYNYSFQWDFGDGSSVTTPVNFTQHTYATAGNFHVSVAVTDPYGRPANASGAIRITAPTTSSVAGLPPTTIAALVIAVIVVAAVIVVGLRMRSAPAPTEPSGPSVPPPESPESSLESEPAEWKAPKP